jgi:hypothetical protein
MDGSGGAAHAWKLPLERLYTGEQYQWGKPKCNGAMNCQRPARPGQAYEASQAISANSGGIRRMLHRIIQHRNRKRTHRLPIKPLVFAERIR